MNIASRIFCLLMTVFALQSFAVGAAGGLKIPSDSPGLALNDGEDFSSLGQPHRISMPDEKARLAMVSDDRVTVEDNSSRIVFSPIGKPPKVGFIFYPGGETAPAVYARPLRKIAEKGYLVVVTYMPRYLAIIAPNKALEIIEAYPEIEKWAIGGHSLGGTAAAKFAMDNQGLISGLIFWDSRPMAPIGSSSNNLRVGLIYRTDQQGNPPESFQKVMPFFSEETEFMPVPGATHMQFGNSIKAKHRPEEYPSISWEETQGAAIQGTLKILERIGGE